MATGLVWTPTGGDITFIEATRMKGSKQLLLTGKLGEVMKESAQAAVSYVRSKADDLAIDERIFSDSDLHIHVPAGAVPKDGPSAGVTMATALVSLLTGRNVLGQTGSFCSQELANVLVPGEQRETAHGRYGRGYDAQRPASRSGRGRRVHICSTSFGQTGCHRVAFRRPVL